MTTKRAQPLTSYLGESQGQLDIGLESDHSKEIYRGFPDHRTNQRRKLERALIPVGIPNDDEERG